MITKYKSFENINSEQLDFHAKGSISDAVLLASKVCWVLGKPSWKKGATVLERKAAIATEYI